jgi:hypothetical protein
VKTLATIALVLALGCTERRISEGEVVLKRHIPEGYTEVFNGESTSTVGTMERYITTIRVDNCVQDVFGKKVYDAYRLHERLDVAYVPEKIQHKGPEGEFSTYGPCNIRYLHKR